ncbi:hypothetical protein [Moritella viscosa]|uniref:Phosphoglucomutase/phosphomannomutase alpha/beta/alpha domain I n=1 Tax=Moritella viscosa TaxID=80854 RepID=A0A1L0A6A3_9GAMM|nr:hypothetical protein [Moritella viscosa]SGZ10104.1 Phosphoglucomutase/phosphomannomutase alpha/beta/alpha domain I [Moritella viscosa]SGZ19217.1 Phosphoglucomutase/phosphomannomutase alpha/beta/alpha domain I [Moritella viscosa]SHO14595.1 Phosphoglucomutase/phosphomannomutase alpha/beta/alpha domain I [Moritella viscosa]SHO15440.1 Phosphoglucomutase/phosphomannomutase alpha/beta/alpha domain I [Moritella viscosa]SHO17997.1 Phosphoglucomutase/phosphomannomutase alpha/beta/alpha domain I [Mor
MSNIINVKVVANGKGRKESLVFAGIVCSLRGENAGVQFGNSSEFYNGDFSATNRVAGKVVAKFKIINAGK